MKKTRMLVASIALAAGLAIPLSAFAVGAIAIDDEAGDAAAGYGLVTGKATQDEAKAAALKECKASGNKNCRVALWFKTCGAYAASKDYYGIGYGKTLTAAKAKALDECGDKACKIVVSDCE